jgi:coenzyme F420-reducing hydrogenase beta subunit
MFLDNFKKENCCGCTACSRVCDFSAITMKQDKNGFYYPEVDKDKCKECGMCEKVCPMKENYVGRDANPDIYAVHNKNQDTVQKSSSGGMFTALAEWIIAQDGVIYGVAFDKNYYVQHMRAADMQEAGKFRTSKYVESDINKVYDTIIEDLKNEKIVLFTGTPCQVSAIKKYLKAKRVNIENLYTCDNICHGVPSRKVWEDYLDIIEQRYVPDGDAIKSINMRSKKTSWQKQNIEIELEKGNIDPVIEEFSFNKFFLSLFSNRPSCFHCHYTSYKRPGDFTLGDFWNVENAGIEFSTEGGVNVVLVNTEKGKALFEQLKAGLDHQPVTKEACWQPHLEYSAKAPAKQDMFWKDYHAAVNKESIIRKYMQGSLVTKVIRTLSPILRKTGLYGFAGKMYKIVLVRKK